MPSEYYLKNRERLIAYQKEYRTKNIDKVRAYRQPRAAAWHKSWRERNKERFYKSLKESQRRQYMLARRTIIEALGGRCVNPNCLVPSGCHDIKCLQLDHINNDGKTDRARFYSSFRMTIYYSRNLDEARKNLQILCANCNWIKLCDTTQLWKNY